MFYKAVCVWTYTIEYRLYYICFVLFGLLFYLLLKLICDQNSRGLLVYLCSVYKVAKYSLLRSYIKKYKSEKSCTIYKG